MQHDRKGAVAWRLPATLLLVTCAVFAQPPSAEQLFREAVAAQQRGDDGTAIEKYQEVLKLRPDVLEARVNLGAALSRQGRFDDAIEQYRIALAKNQGNAAIRMNLALAFYKKGAFPDAAGQFAILHKADPNNSRIATLLADCDAHLGKNDQVVAILQPIEFAHPGDLGVAWLLGSALIRTGHNREGLKLVEKVATQANDPEAYLLAGQTALQLNEFEPARDYAESAARLNPHLPGVQTLRGMTLQYLGATQNALAAFRQALADDPNDFEAHLGLGAGLNNERDLEGARQHLERALALRPDSNLARYEMARLERTEGKLAEALKDFEKVVHDDPSWPQPHIELSALYFRMNRPEDGERERELFDRLSAEKRKR